MKSIEIGVATLEYSEDGVMSGAGFIPTLTLNVGPTDPLKEQLRTVGAAYDPETVKQQAELVLGGWFSTLNDIELADRDTHTISSEVVHCEKHTNGTVKTCKIKFTLTNNTMS